MNMLKDKVIIITGGAGLLGRTFVEAVIQQNGIAIIADNNLSAANKIVHDLNASGKTNVEAIELDITSKASINNCIEVISKKYGKIDSLVNNAYPRNKNYGRKFYEVEFSDFCENLNLNLGGYFLSSQQFAALFEKQGHGNIINISSIYGVVPPKFGIYENTKMTMPVEYAVIKSGLIHLTKYMAKQFKGKNIRVNAISPGGIIDGQPEEFTSKYKEHTLNKGMLDRKDISGTLIYLLSDLSTFVNGQNIIVDDGFTL
jgi:NAD(P)-dependent dehydrogenase (short-subunit alcohol dehydrogenase family)